MKRWMPWPCRRVSADLVDLAAGRLPSGRRARLGRHLRRCAECRRDLRALRRLAAGGREREEPAFAGVPWELDRAAIMRDVRAAAAAREPQPARSWWSDPRLVLAGVVPLLIAVAGTLWLGGEVARVQRLAAVERLAGAELLALAEMAGVGEAAVATPADAAVEAGVWLGMAEEGAPQAAADLPESELMELRALLGDNGVV